MISDVQTSFLDVNDRNIGDVTKMISNHWQNSWDLNDKSILRLQGKSTLEIC